MGVLRDDVDHTRSRAYCLRKKQYIQQMRLEECKFSMALTPASAKAVKLYVAIIFPIMMH